MLGVSDLISIRFDALGLSLLLQDRQQMVIFGMEPDPNPSDFVAFTVAQGTAVFSNTH